MTTAVLERRTVTFDHCEPVSPRHRGDYTRQHLTRSDHVALWRAVADARLLRGDFEGAKAALLMSYDVEDLTLHPILGTARTGW